MNTQKIKEKVMVWFAILLAVLSSATGAVTPFLQVADAQAINDNLDNSRKSGYQFKISDSSGREIDSSSNYGMKTFRQNSELYAYCNDVHVNAINNASYVGNEDPALGSQTVDVTAFVPAWIKDNDPNAMAALKEVPIDMLAAMAPEVNWTPSEEHHSEEFYLALQDFIWQSKGAQISGKIANPALGQEDFTETINGYKKIIVERVYRFMRGAKFAHQTYPIKKGATLELLDDDVVDGNGNGTSIAWGVTDESVKKLADKGVTVDFVPGKSLKITASENATATENDKLEFVYSDPMIDSETHGPSRRWISADSQELITLTYPKAKFNVDIVLEEPEPIKLDLPITKTMENRGMHQGEFVFKISAAEGSPADTPLPRSTELVNQTTSDHEKLTFKDITFTKPGTYSYIIEEVKGNDVSVDYDSAKYQVTVEVINQNGSLIATVSPDLEKNPMKFTNKLFPGDLKIAKKVTGLPAATERLFEFTIVVDQPLDGTYSGYTFTPNADGNSATTKVQIKGNEEVIISGLPAGLKYTITETNAEGYTPEGNQYEQSGQIKGKKESEHTFINNYDASPTKTSITGVKGVDGSEWAEDWEFTFQMRAANDLALKVLPAPMKETVTKDNPNFAFEIENIKQPGEYQFEIVELFNQSNAIPGVTQDNSRYLVTFNVIDKEDNGKLTVENKKIEKIVYGTNAEGQQIEIEKQNADEPIDFTNNYATDKIGYAIGGNKKLTGRNLHEGEFEFRLTRDNQNNPMPDGVAAGIDSIKTTNLSSGSFAFPNITFTQAGEYSYTISEVNTRTPGIDFDERNYQFLIKVVDNGKGKLEIESVTIKLLKDGEPSGEALEELIFTNAYDAKGRAVVEGTKRLVGRNLAEAGNEFKFKLVPIRGQINGSGEIAAKDVPTPNNTTGETAVISNAKPGSDPETAGFKFAEITFAQAGEYIYELTEVSDDPLKDMIYSGAKYTVVITVTDNGDGSLTTSVTYEGLPAEQALPEFVNNYSPKGSLKVEKSVTGNAKDSNQEFKFEIKVDENISGEFETINQENQTGSVEFKKGIATITLKDREFLIIKGLPVGTKYTIREIRANQDGYETTIDSDGEITDNEKGIVAGDINDQLATTTYTNDKRKGKIKLEGIKQVEGRKWKKDDRFSFQLTGKDEASRAVLPAGGLTTTVQSSGTESDSYGFSFDEIHFTKEGLYTFIVTELNPKIPGISPDNKIYEVTVEVKKAEDRLDAQILSIKNDQEELNSPEIKFVNRYRVNETSLSLIGNKELTGRNLKEKEFTFKLTAVSGREDGQEIPIASIPMPAGTVGNAVTTQNTAAGTYSFDEITYTRTGVYEYVVEEVPENLPGVTYDTEEYEVTVIVTDPENNGKLVAVAYTKKDSEIKPVTTLNFENKYQAKGAATLRGNKILTGRDLKAAEFEFEIVAISAKGVGDRDIPKDQIPLPAEVIVSHTSAAEGQPAGFEFGQIAFTEPGVYYYQVKENQNNIPNIEYAKNVYEVVITVTDTGNGTLATEIKHNGAEEMMTFVNKFGSVGDLQLNKKVTGIGDQNREFTFNIKLSNQPTLGGRYGDIEFANGFGQIKLKGGETKTAVGLPAGTEYEVTEVEANQEGYVTTSKYAAGIIGAAQVIQVEYNNHMYAPVDLTIDGDKTLTGRDWLDDDIFNFKLVGADEASRKVLGNKVLEAKVDDNSSEVKKEFSETVKEALTPFNKTSVNKGFSFDQINFTEPGEYRFHVMEYGDGGISGISYDSTVYTITVSVSEKAGELTANIVSKTKIDETGKEQEVQKISFVNHYDSDEVEISLNGTKELTGRSLEAEEFAFKLKAITGNNADGEAIPNNQIPMPKNSEQTAQIVKNSEAGTFNFGAMTYTQAGVFKYQVAEVKGDVSGITYDEKLYDVVVTVTDNKKGELTAKYEILNKEEKVANLLFENKYNALGRAKIKGDKRLVGRNMEKGEFEFMISGVSAKDTAGKEISEIPLPSKLIETNKAAKAGEKGAFSFESIEFKQAGKYRYLIKEDAKKQLENITYDDTEFFVTINVKDKKDGTLETEVIYEDSSDGIVFENQYRAYGGLKISKKVTGNQGDKNADFTFQIELNDQGISGKYGDIDFTNGKATITLKDGESKQAEKLPAGVSYKVNESEANQDGYTTTSKRSSGTISSGTTLEAIFTNHRDKKDGLKEDTSTGSQTGVAAGTSSGTSGKTAAGGTSKAAGTSGTSGSYPSTGSVLLDGTIGFALISLASGLGYKRYRKNRK